MDQGLPLEVLSKKAAHGQWVQAAAWEERGRGTHSPSLRGEDRRTVVQPVQLFSLLLQFHLATAMAQPSQAPQLGLGHPHLAQKPLPLCFWPETWELPLPQPCTN